MSGFYYNIPWPSAEKDYRDSYDRIFGHKEDKMIQTEIKQILKSYDGDICYALRRLSYLEQLVAQMQAKITAQAGNEGLWCDPQFASEAYIQNGLKELTEEWERLMKLVDTVSP